MKALPQDTTTQTSPPPQQSSQNCEPLAVSIREACRITGLSRSTIYKEIASGRIQAVKASKRTLIPLESLRAWLASLPKSHVT